jgi:hypothetical protein
LDIIVDHFQSRKSIIMRQYIALKMMICIDGGINAMLALFVFTALGILSNNARVPVVKFMITEGDGDDDDDDDEPTDLSLLSSYPRKLSLPAGTSARRPGYQGTMINGW